MACTRICMVQIYYSMEHKITSTKASQINTKSTPNQHQMHCCDFVVLWSHKGIHTKQLRATRTQLKGWV